MNISNEQFEEAYQKATPGQKYLCSQSGGDLMKIAEKYDLKDQEVYKKFAIAVGDIVLGFYRTEDIANLMQQELSLSPQMSIALANDIKVFLQPLSDPNWKNPNEINAEAIIEQDTIQQDILEAEAVLNTIPKPIPKPTEAVYTSTQSAILSEAKAVNAPTTTQPPTTDTPRWDTEQ